jgi:uncharacterized membrane protein
MTISQKTSPLLMRLILALVLLVGIFFRVYNLDYKVFWVDEAYTALRMSGYTEAEFVQQVFTGEIVTAEALQRYQTPENRPFADTLTALKGNAEHAPLYFVLARCLVCWCCLPSIGWGESCLTRLRPPGLLWR